MVENQAGLRAGSQCSSQGSLWYEAGEAALGAA